MKLYQLFIIICLFIGLNTSYIKCHELNLMENSTIFSNKTILTFLAIPSTFLVLSCIIKFCKWKNEHNYNTNLAQIFEKLKTLQQESNNALLLKKTKLPDDIADNIADIIKGGNNIENKMIAELERAHIANLLKLIIARARIGNIFLQYDSSIRIALFVSFDLLLLKKTYIYLPDSIQEESLRSTISVASWALTCVLVSGITSDYTMLKIRSFL